MNSKRHPLHAVGLIAAASLLLSPIWIVTPSPATAEVLFDHVDATASTPVISQFPIDFPNEGAAAHDDFTIPAGEVWSPQRLFIDGSASGTATSAEFGYQLYRGNGPPVSSNTVYGDKLNPLAGTAWPDATLDVHIGGVLAPGNYLLGAEAFIARNPGANYWYWQANDELFGAPAFWQENGAYGTGCVASPMPRSSACLPGTGPDQSFRLEGIRAPDQLEVIRVKARKNARLRLEVSVPTCCGIDLKSAQMNTKAGVIPHEIGPFTFKLQPKAKTLRQVEAGQKVLATVQMRTPAIVGLGSPTATIVKRLKR